MTQAGKYRCGSCGNMSGPELNAEGWVLLSFIPLVWIELFGGDAHDERQREQTSHATVCGDCMTNMGMNDLPKERT